MSATLESVAEAIHALRKAHDVDARLWDTADVAEFLKLNPAYTRAHILTRSDFPKSVDLPGKGREPIRRYRPVDVRDWAEKWR